LQEATVGLVVSGPWWLDAGDDRKDGAGQRRLHDPADWVAIEVQTLLQRTLHSGGPVPVIPVFIGGAEMPKRATCPDSTQIIARPQWPAGASRAGLRGVGPQPHRARRKDSRLHAAAAGGDRSCGDGASTEGLTHAPRCDGEKIVGREEELHVLDEAWGRSAGDKINIVSLIGQGGEGKTAIVLEWYSRRVRHGWQGARRVFDWSFYSQGTNAQSSAPIVYSISNDNRVCENSSVIFPLPDYWKLSWRIAGSTSGRLNESNSEVSIKWVIFEIASLRTSST
jgi:hypothetical protein